MRYEGQQITAPQLHATVENGVLILLSSPRVGSGVWAINLDETFPDGAQVRLEEQLLIEGFDLPAGSATYGRKLYLRNTTPVVHTLSAIATVHGGAPVAVTPKKAVASK